MIEFSNVFYTVNMLQSKATTPSPPFLRANLDCKRQIWPAAWCGLRYVRLPLTWIP